jgi:hypothetical protein
MIGGPDSFGPGGYWKSPVERVLPVDMDVADRRHYPSVGLILAIDKSGSMAGVAVERKIDVAKTAAAEVAAELAPIDRIGVIGFDAAAKWVVPVMPGGDSGTVVSRLATVRAGGGTDAYPAMELAREALDGLDVRVKHVILLTDGQLASRDHEGLAATMAASGITLSTVAVGRDADLYTLERIAERGGGEFYIAADIQRVPRIFLREAFKVSRAWLVEEPFQPVPEMDHTVLTGIDVSQAPPLEGYVVTTPKPSARHLWTTPKGDPLLSLWRYGLGKSVAFTSDAEPRWAASWVRWPVYSPFWSRLIRWSARDNANERLRVVSEVGDQGLRISADFVAPDGSAVNGARLSAVVAAPDGSRVERSLEQVAPGRYETLVPLASTGVYLSAVVDEAENVGNVSTAVLPYSAEFNTLGRFPEGLERLTIEGAVRSVENVEELFVHTGGGGTIRHSLVPWFLAVAATLLLAEVAARRLHLPRRKLPVHRPSSTARTERLLGARSRARVRTTGPTGDEREGTRETPPAAASHDQEPARETHERSPQPSAKDEPHTSRLLRTKRRRWRN